MDRSCTPKASVRRRASDPGLLPVVLAALLPAVTAHAQFDADEEYIRIGYTDEATGNPVARLQGSLLSGELSLEYSETRGYFDSLLEVLDIDPESQSLVFSATSLQAERISQATPRGLYFNDETYLGFVQDSPIVEVATIDEDLGVVFYTFDNTQGSSKYFERANQSCLVCHDTQGTTGGGVPMLIALSAVYSERNVPLLRVSGTGNVGDQTPVADRWGGWYVTGRHGVQAHLGNLMLADAGELAELDDHRIWNLETLDGAGYFDTSEYVRATSDIVGLMVLEHQITVQNQIAYIKFKAPAVLSRRGMDSALAARTWAELPAEARALLPRMLDKLVSQLVFIDAADIASRLSGSAAFVDRFVARGPFDQAGRTLRELDADGRLFRYPLSYLIYSDGFATLPAYAKDYIYRRLAAWLRGDEDFDGSTQYTRAERRAALEILAATEPAFARHLRFTDRGSAGSSSGPGSASSP